MAKEVCLVRHGDDPPDDRIVLWLAANGFAPRIVRPFAGEDLPASMDGIAGTVIFRRKYAAYETDEYPFLLREYDWIDRSMAAGLPLLGICQGAQMIAWRLGAEVGPPSGGEHEFGYYEIKPTEAGRDLFPDTLFVAQSHYHTFGIPAGAERLAGSSLFPNQAFRLGERIYGFQFHPEVTMAGFRRWQDAPWAAYGKPGAQTRAEQDVLMAEHDRHQEDWLHGFLERLFVSRGVPA